MKTVLRRGFLLLLPLSLAISCIDNETGPCRISEFYWEGEWYTAQYNGSGRLRGLIAADSKIIFYYDNLSRLTSAEIYFRDLVPLSRYDFIHGPHGIIEADHYYRRTWGTAHSKIIYHYASPTVVNQIIKQEFDDSGEVTFEICHQISYSGGNVQAILGDKDVTEYYGNEYDKKRNPFRTLAASVGNVFFPVAVHANFPINGGSREYDISLLSLLSRNNPLRAQYRVMGTELQHQIFSYTYDGNIAESLRWDHISGDLTSTEEYAFKFACGPFKAHE